MTKNSIVGGSVSGAACLLLPPCRTVEPAALPSPHSSFNSPLYEQNLLWLSIFHFTERFFVLSPQKWKSVPHDPLTHH